MNESTNPLSLPEQTLPQTGPGPSQSTEADTPRPAARTQADSTGTVAAPENYNPSAVAPSSRATGSGETGAAYSAGSLAGRYAVLRALAKGGMGQVSVARDTELDRDIALKEIQPKFKMDTATLHRFILEARVTGKLEHPGIVPVYGLGKYDDGRPYYAMRFITGESFQDAIKAFHDKESPDRDPQERSLALRQLLRRFVDVCNTIGYAHSRGVLHRDIKPANVMIGHYGETLVVDWGLAKEMADPKPLPTVAVSDAKETVVFQPIDPKEFQETQEGFTLYGQTMGTPAYMSPEQALGKWDVTGIGSDIYSLGAMLYAILSGTPPYSGPSYEVITRVQRGEYTPVMLVKGNTPSPLDAICRKAMAFEITNRYPSALALAADVERWLADEPVSCYREPFLTRASRWAKRHRTAVAAASVLLLTGTIALTVGLYLVNHERREKEKAFNLASESRGETREAMLALTDDALGDILASSSKATPEQVKFLDTIIERYRHFAEKEPDSPDSKLFTAKAWYRIGRIQARVERYDLALTAYQQAMDTLADPAIAARMDVLSTRGEVQLYRGIVWLQRGKPEAEAEFLAARKSFEELIANEAKPEYRARLSQCEDRLGVFCMIHKRFDDAETLFHESLALRLQLMQESPADPEYQYRVAQTYRMLTDVNFKKGNIPAGREAAAKALEVLNKLAADHPTSVAYLRVLADMETLMAEHYIIVDDPNNKFDPSKAPFETPALIHARSAVRTWGRLVALNPGDLLLRQRLAEANSSLAHQSRAHHRPREAIAALATAVTILKEIDRDEPDNTVTQLKLVQALHGLAAVLREVMDKNTAAAMDEAVAAADAILKKLPGNREGEKYAALAHIERAGFRLAKAGVNGTQADPAGAKADLAAAWPHLESCGDIDAALKYSRAFADWMDDVNDFQDAETTGVTIAALKLPGGMAPYIAACYYGRVVKLIVDSPDADAAKIAFANKQRGLAIYFLREAVKAGFDRVDLLESQPDLVQVRPADQFREIIESLKSKAPPKAKDN